MDTEHHTLELIRQDIVKNHLQVTAIIQVNITKIRSVYNSYVWKKPVARLINLYMTKYHQINYESLSDKICHYVARSLEDIQQCTGPLELLNELNAEGRAKIAAFKSSIEELVSVAEREPSQEKKGELLTEVHNYKQQLETSLAAFRNANVASALVIDTLDKAELLSTPEEQTAVRRKRDKQSLTNTSSQLSDKLLSISRHLAETNFRSADTLDTLITSSDKISNTQNELHQQQHAIVQSGKLVGKYGRREVTDKALIALAFVFFLASVFYILQKRLF